MANKKWFPCFKVSLTEFQISVRFCNLFLYRSKNIKKVLVNTKIFLQNKEEKTESIHFEKICF